jgi:hypothetical protein
MSAGSPAASSWALNSGKVVPGAGGTGPEPFELGRAVASCCPQAGVEEASTGIEDVGVHGGVDGAQLVGHGFDEAADGGLGRGVDAGVGDGGHAAVARRGGDDRRPPCPASSIRGRKVRTVWATPKTFTEKHQRQSLISCSHGRPPPPEVTPALAKRRSQRPSVP